MHKLSIRDLQIGGGVISLAACLFILCIYLHAPGLFLMVAILHAPIVGFAVFWRLFRMPLLGAAVGMFALVMMMILMGAYVRVFRPHSEHQYEDDNWSAEQIAPVSSGY
jgi:hypothetical protein